MDNHWNNFGPRLGFAYDLTGQGKSVLRGGFGIMFDRVQGNDMYNGATNTPFDASPTLHSVLLANPGISVTNNNPPLTSAQLPVLPVGITGVDNANAKLPTSYQYSFGIQQALGRTSVLTLNYVGTQVRHLNDYRAINLPDIADLAGINGLVATNGASCGLQTCAGGLNTDPTLSYPGFGGIRMAGERSELALQFSAD